MSVRVRFAPSPTGPLHIGGVRTALYNYLFARRHGGQFILRIEDTDRGRYVEGAQQYIIDALNWLGMDLDEGPVIGGDYGPYMQSERLEIYKDNVKTLLSNGSAYYAFDTPEEIEAMRARKEADGQHSPKYDHASRMEMTNSLTLTKDEVLQKLVDGTPYTIRLKIDPGEEIIFQDLVRGEVRFKSEELDDKVLMKSDGWPTYHLANVVDDHSMAISHVIRGEEWLSSTPHHVYLYKAFGWIEKMPQFVHLPLILKPSGKGKLSKRDGAKFGFPVFPMNWQGEELYEGFKEKGFLPEAVLNFLALLGWHPSDDREMFDLESLCKEFEVDRIAKSGARFDYEKAKWFNQQYLISMSPEAVAVLMAEEAMEKYGDVDHAFLTKVAMHMMPRVEFVGQIIEDGAFFFENPSSVDEKTVRKRFKSESEGHLNAIINILSSASPFEAENIQNLIKGYITDQELSFGAIMPLLRIGVSGTLKGPDLFAIFEVLGQKESCERLRAAIESFKSIVS